MYGHYMDAWDWLWMGLFWVAVVGFGVFVAVKLIDRNRQGKAGT